MPPFIDPTILYAAFTLWESGSYGQKQDWLLLAGDQGIANSEDAKEAFLKWARSVRFTPDAIQKLGAMRGPNHLPMFNESFLNYLQRFSFKCTVDVLNGNHPTSPGSPMFLVRGPIIQLTLVQTALEQLTGGLIRPS